MGSRIEEDPSWRLGTLHDRLYFVRLSSCFLHRNFSQDVSHQACRNDILDMGKGQFTPCSDLSGIHARHSLGRMPLTATTAETYDTSSSDVMTVTKNPKRTSLLFRVRLFLLLPKRLFQTWTSLPTPPMISRSQHTTCWTTPIIKRKTLGTETVKRHLRPAIQDIYMGTKFFLHVYQRALCSIS